MSEFIIVKNPRYKRRRERQYDLPTIDELYRQKQEELQQLEKVRKEFVDAEKKKHEPRKGHTFTFTEGMLLAFMAQFFLGPTISAFLKAQGLQ